MPIKKSNLSPDVKSKLRRVVLEEIGDQPKTLSAVGGLKSIPKANSIARAVKPTISAKVEEFEITKPTKPKLKIKPKTGAKAKAKSAKKTKAGSAKKAVVAAVAAVDLEVAPKAGLEMDKKSKFGGFYGSGAKRTEYKPAWERVKKEDKSLEEFFKKSALASKPARSGIFSGLFKEKPSVSVMAPVIPSTPKPAKAGWPGGVVKILALLILLAVLLLAFDILGIYLLGFKDSISLQTVKYLNLPAGQVDGQFIPASAYLDDLKTLALPLSQNREGLVDYSGGATEIKDKILYRLAANQLVRKKLVAYDKSVSDQDVNNQMSLLVQQVGDQPQTEKMVKDLYGLNLNQFRSKIILPMMERENLQMAIMEDEELPINLEAKKTAEDILSRALASSSDFSSLAQKYTQDETGVNTGGDLGWVIRGQLDKQWEDLVFSASSSAVLPQLLKSRFGYHVIKVEQKLADETNGQESIKLKHILLKVNVDSYIKSLLDSASLVKYIK